MISPELAKKIRYIQIYTSKAVNDVLAGEYHSVFKGRGMEFDEVREYQIGDDIRTIDWNVTARTGVPHVKRYVEERELTIMFMVDLSASGTFGSGQRSKNELVAEFCALLAFSAIKNNDKVGLIIFTDTVELFVPPAKGTRHVLRIIRELLSFSPQRSGTDINAALDYLGRVMVRRGIVFLVSDFQASGYERPLRVMARRHDCIGVSVSDPREHQLPAAGLIELEDAESGERIVIDTASSSFRQHFMDLANQQRAELASRLGAAQVDHIALSTGREYTTDLISFFRQRGRRQ